MQRIIEHSDHKDTEQNFDGVWAVVECNVRLETQMHSNWTETEEQVQERAARIKLGGRNWFPENDDEREQLRVMMNITPEAQTEYERQAAEIEADNEWLVAPHILTYHNPENCKGGTRVSTGYRSTWSHGGDHPLNVEGAQYTYCTKCAGIISLDNDIARNAAREANAL